jgi:hypothetical protein
VASCVISGAAISEAHPTPSTTGDTQRRDAALARAPGGVAAWQGQGGHVRPFLTVG